MQFYTSQETKIILAFKTYFRDIVLLISQKLHNISKQYFKVSFLLSLSSDGGRLM